VFLIWYPDGKPKNEYNYLNGEFEGEQKEYFASGQLKLKTTYRNHVKDGVYEEWYENGKPTIHAVLKDGIRDGLYQEWYENGNPRLEEFYFSGSLIRPVRNGMRMGFSSSLGLLPQEKNKGSIRNGMPIMT